MVGFGSSLRMSRRRGWEDAYLDYASLRLLLTQIEAVYEDSNWVRGDSDAYYNNSGSTGGGGGYNDVYLEEGGYDDHYHEEDDNNNSNMMEEDDQEEEVITNGYLPSVFQSAWAKTRSVVTGQPTIPNTTRSTTTTTTTGGGGGHRYNNKRRRRQRITASREQQQQQDSSEYFEYSPTGGGGGRGAILRGRGRGRLLRRRRNRRRNTTNHNNNSTSGHHRHHAKSTNNSRGKKGGDDDVGGGDETNEEDDYYYDDRALDKGGWRMPGVLDYRDELFLESDDDLAFGYYDEEEENEETEEEEEEGEWVDEEEEENNVYQYGHDDTMVDNHYGTDDFFEENNHDVDINIENNHNELMVGDDSRLMLERPSSSDDSNIRAELTIATTASGEMRSSPNNRRDVMDCSSSINVVSSNDGRMRTPKSQRRHIFSSSSDPDNNNNNNMINTNLLETPELIPQFTESPGVLEAGYETFAAAAARRGDMGEAQEHAMYVGSPAQRGWFDFIMPSLFGDNNNKQKTQQTHQQRGESRPLLFHRNDDEEATGEDHHHHHDVDNRGNEQLLSPEDNIIHHEDSSLGDSTHRYTSLRSKTSPTRFLPAPRQLSKTAEESDNIESKFSFGPSAFVDDREASALDSPPRLPTKYPTKYRSSPVMATAIGSSMPMTPTSPSSLTYSRDKSFVDEGVVVEKGIVGFGVPIQMIPTEAVELLRPSSPRKSPTQSNFGSSRFYSFQNDSGNNDADGDGIGSVGSHEHSDGGGEYNQSNNMISFYSGGGRGGDNFSLLSPPNNNIYRQQQQQHHHHHHPSLSSNAPSQHQFLSENPIMNLLIGRSADWDHGGRSTIKTAGKKKKKKKSKMSSSSRGGHHHPTAHKNAAPNTLPSSYSRPSTKQSRAAAAAKSKRARLRRQRRLLRRQKREERIPHHLRAAHVRAAAITERFRGLLRAEVEKVILFANSRLGELSDTIGCLRYSSYEDEQDDRKAHPHLADGGIHQLSSSDEEDGGGHHASDASSSSDGEAQNLDTTIEQDAATRRQIIMRDRMRMMRPLFQKADFLGEDFSLLSAVDEADAYAAVGVELMHLLKYVCVNIIAVRKICKKHDRLLSNRMVGGYYKRLAAEAKKSQNQRGFHHQFHWNEPQFGGTLSNPSSAGGYIYGIYDTKIQHIANSTTMQTVSSSLSIALADFEASQSRSARLGLGFEPAKEFVVGGGLEELPTPRKKTSSKSRGVLSYQLGGHCFRGDDDSSVASQEKDNDNESASSNIALTRLQFVVTSIFGLREAARIKLEPFEQYSSRLFMTSTGPNVVGDGLDGCSRETLDLLCSYNPDAAYTLDSETLYASLKIGRENEGVGSVMVASLAAAAKGSDVISNNIRYRRKVSAALCIKPQLAGEVDSPQSYSQAKNRNILAMNAASMVLYLVNYYCVVPVAHIHSTQVGSVSSSALLIGAANVTAIVSSCVHAVLASKRKSFTKKHLNVSFFRRPLILSALFPLIGNILYSLSVKRKSLEMALIGRLLVGLGSAEVLNRRLVSTVLPKESVNGEVASLVKKSMFAVTAGLLLGALVDVQVSRHRGYNLYGVSDLMLEGSINNSINDTSNATTTLILDTSNATLVNGAIIVPSNTAADPFSSSGASESPSPHNIGIQQPFLPFYPLNPSLMPFGYHRLLSLESVGIVMACLWFFQLVTLLFFFDVPSRKDELVTNVNNSFENANKLDLALEEDFDSDSVGSENAKMSSIHAHKPSFDSTGTNPFASEGLLEQEEIGTHGTFEKLQVMSRKTVKNQYKGSYLESIACVRRLAMSNIAYPTSVSLLFLARAVTEVILSSCASIMYRYFWSSGAKSGLFMGVMACCVLPINISFSSEKNFTERNIIKNALVAARYGLFLMVNYEALFYSIKNAIFRSANHDHSLSYDGFLGPVQYTICFAIVFLSVSSLESVTLSLLSKVSPIPLRKYSLDSSFAVIFVSSLGRIAGDVLVWCSDLSSWVFFNDVVNTLCCCLIISLLVGSYVVKKHYFFLI